MLDRLPDRVEKGRVKGGAYGTTHGDRWGAFVLHHPSGSYLRVIASDGSDWSDSGLPWPAWEHVSVGVMPSSGIRCPTWEEMCWVKGLFWGPEECVVQYHTRASQYVNCHEYVLHLWKPVGAAFPEPPPECVGPPTPARGA